MTLDSINCDGAHIDLVVDDSSLMPLVQDVLEVVLAGILQGYAAREEGGAPVYLYDGLDIAA